MIPLEKLSPVGFGTHLVSDENPEHHSAMSRALSLGCNLIDTSANYLRGASERLIGRVLACNPTVPVFVMTKSGYDQSERLPLIASDDLRGDLLHPKFLANRISLSLSRLGRRHLDGFLLHSPEAFLEEDSGIGAHDRFYARIASAFQYLEGQVAAGVIRYYGLSSNTIARPREMGGTIDLHRIMQAARSASAEHHCKLLEFPYNFVEIGATADRDGDGSLVSLAKNYGLVTFSNRPLNANIDTGAARLAFYKVEPPPVDSMAFEKAKAAMRRELLRKAMHEDVMAFPVVKFLGEWWTKLGNPEAVEDIFLSHLQPLLNALYEGTIPPADAAIFADFYAAALSYSRYVQGSRTTSLVEELKASGAISNDDDRPLPLIACETYLGRGIDHVLVGMRRTQYVDELKDFFTQRKGK